MGGPREITRLLLDVKAGSREAEDELMRAVYPELRRIAARCLQGERPGHLLQATDLVNETFLQLMGQFAKDWQNRNHFYGVTAKLMRRILVDFARERSAKKRGGGAAPIELSDVMTISENKLHEVLLVDAALNRLADFDARQSRIVELRFFGGLTEPEIADILGVSTRTVKRDWNVARAWLYGELNGAPPTEE